MLLVMLIRAVHFSGHVYGCCWTEVLCLLKTNLSHYPQINISFLMAKEMLIIRRMIFLKRCIIKILKRKVLVLKLFSLCGVPALAFANMEYLWFLFLVPCLHLCSAHRGGIKMLLVNSVLLFHTFA